VKPLMAMITLSPLPNRGAQDLYTGRVALSWSLRPGPLNGSRRGLRSAARRSLGRDPRRNNDESVIKYSGGALTFLRGQCTAYTQVTL
jgi:hypothetical protein